VKCTEGQINVDCIYIFRVKAGSNSSSSIVIVVIVTVTVIMILWSNQLVNLIASTCKGLEMYARWNSFKRICYTS